MATLTSTRRWASAAGAATVAALAIWLLWPAGPEAPTPLPSDDDDRAALAANGEPKAAPPRPDGSPIAEVGNSAARPIDWAAFLATSSLRDAEIDGEVRLDDAGRVVADLPLRRLFDQLLSLAGELDSASIRRLLADLVAGRHGEAVAREVVAIYDRYVQYLAAVADARLGALADLRERHDRIRALRRQWLGADLAAAFFAPDEALAEHTLARIAIARDPTLDADARAARLAALDAGAPAAIREARRDAVLADLLAEQQRQFDQLAIDPATRQTERAALFGPEAAARLAAVDAAEAEWQRRLADYARAAASIRADPALDAAARATALDAELARRFDEAAQRRVRSLEAAGLLPGPGG